MAYKNSDTYQNGLSVYLCNEQNIDFTTIPSTDANTVKTVEDYIGANFTFTRAVGWEGQVLGLDSTQEEQVLEAAECDLWEINRSSKTLANFVGNFFSVRDEWVLEKIAYLIWGKYETEAGTPVNLVWEALWTNAAVWDIVFLANKNWDNTIVTNVVVDLAGTPLVAWTDYKVEVDDGSLGRLWDSYIVFLLAQTGVLDVDYDYTPAAAYRIWVSGNRKSKKYTIIKFVACAVTPDGGWTAVSDVFYLVKCYLSASYDIAFPKGSEAFAPAPLNFTEATGWDYTGKYWILN